jgi:hypothetical protein
MKKIYHRNVWLPDKINKILPEYRVSPVYSIHAMDSAEHDPFEVIVLPCVLTLDKEHTVEVTTDEDKITQILYRFYYSEEFDLCVVILLPSLMVKTVWLQLRDDDHSTLDLSKYEKDV